MSKLLSIGTALPSGLLSQGEALAQATFYNCSSARDERVLQKLYQKTRIESRPTIFCAAHDHTAVSRSQSAVKALDDFYPRPHTVGSDNAHCPACQTTEAEHGQPGTAARMERYRQEITPLAGRAARQALDKIGMPANCIENLVTVSCTGFFAPGLDTEIIQALSLPRGVSRTHVGFMGCHGAMNGLRVGSALARASQSNSLVLAAELCSLHFQYGYKTDDLLANALFGDGAAAAVLAGGSAAAPGQGCELLGSASYLVPGTSDAMTWMIGDHGFQMTLSPKVPDLIEEYLTPWLTDWLATYDLTLAEIGSFAVHPGGPRVLEAVETALCLPALALAESREVFTRLGNMSSPTILFIVDRLLSTAAPMPLVALAFGPGLTIEAALFS